MGSRAYTLELQTRKLSAAGLHRFRVQGFRVLRIRVQGAGGGGGRTGIIKVRRVFIVYARRYKLIVCVRKLK